MYRLPLSALHQLHLSTRETVLLHRWCLYPPRLTAQRLFVCGGSGTRQRTLNTTGKGILCSLPFNCARWSGSVDEIGFQVAQLINKFTEDTDHMTKIDQLVATHKHSRRISLGHIWDPSQWLLFHWRCVPTQEQE